MNTIETVKALPGASGTNYIYQVTYTDGTVSFVPVDPLNKDYAASQSWIAAGGTLE